MPNKSFLNVIKRNIWKVLNINLLTIMLYLWDQEYGISFYISYMCVDKFISLQVQGRDFELQ